MSDKSTKINSKEEKARLKAEATQKKAQKKAALRELNKLKKQIKRNKLPLDATPQVTPAAEPYGEILPYPGGFPVYLCKYVILADDSSRVAMRFFNAGDILVNGIRFVLTEKDKDGNAIASSTLERMGLFAERGTEFAVADALVSSDCVAVEVRISAIRSDVYEYVLDGEGNVTLRYGTSDKSAELYFKDERTYSVKKRGKGYILISIFAVLCLAAVAAVVAWRLGIFSNVQQNYANLVPNSNFTYSLIGGDINVEP